MINSYDYYRKLVTSEYRYAPKFTAMLKKLVTFGLDIDSAVDKMLLAFEIDNANTDQLDILGKCVGVTRTLTFTPSIDVSYKEIISPQPAEMEDVTTFEVTPTPSAMASSDIDTGLSPKDMADGNVLGDEIFRLMIKARIIQNVWKGTITELYSLWEAVFGTEKHLSIQDLQDMSYNLVLRGNYSQLEQELITHAYIVPKPEGVRINIITFVSADGLPIFSYDYNTLTYSGYGAHWAEGVN